MQVFVTLPPAVRVLAAGTALSLAFGGVAMAADANAVADRLKALYAEKGATLSFDAVQASGSDIVLKGTTVKLPWREQTSLPVGDVTLQNVTDQPDGGYKVAHVTVPDFNIPATADKGNSASFSGMAIENLVIPSESAKGPLDDMLSYDKLTNNEVHAGKQGGGNADIKGIDISFDKSQEPEKMGYSATVASIDATFPDGVGNPLAPLDTNTLHATLDIKGTWSPNSGDLTFDKLEIDAADLGKLNITGSFGGYDLAFLDAVKKTRTSMRKANTDKKAASLAMLGLAEQLNVKSLSIRFDNDQLTQKLLAHYAKLQGADAKTLSQQVQMMVPLMATRLKNPDFTQQLKAASDKYFSDPKSLTISASPDQPVTFASIAATASLDPTKIIQLLKVGVDANN